MIQDTASPPALGVEMWKFAEELFPICRSLSGDGVRLTLQKINRVLGGGLTLHEVPTGTQCFDWTVPKEWNIREAYILTPDGRKICDFKKSNLHVVGYSSPFRGKITLEELQKHLHSLPDQPDAVPYVTSYYKERWGFCLADRERRELKAGEYSVVVDSELKDGFLTYGEIVLPGESKDEIFLSTYVCHPSMGNNEVSGPSVTAHLLRHLASLPRRRFTVRAVFLPETIGALVYLSRHLEDLRKNMRAGFVVTCVGDDRAYSFLPSRRGDTLADRAARHVLEHLHPDYKRYTFLQRGSDERQYCSPGVDLPVALVMRSKFGEYPEYHTSADDMKLITPSGLQGAFDALLMIIGVLEANEKLRATVCGEPQLGKRGLYPTTSTKESGRQSLELRNLLAYSDGRELLEIAEVIGVPAYQLVPLVERLKKEGLLETAR